MGEETMDNVAAVVAALSGMSWECCFSTWPETTKTLSLLLLHDYPSGDVVADEAAAMMVVAAAVV
jgi:hypothetical protein